MIFISLLTVVAIGFNQGGECNVSSWTNIVSIAAGGAHSVALRDDGTVVAAGSNDFGECDVSALKNIISVDAGGYHFTTALTSDGELITIGNNDNSQWINTNIK